MDYEKYIEKLMSPKRYRHCLGVRDMAVRLAEKYGADKEKAYLAGLLHDVVKDFSYDEMMDYANKNGVVLEEFIVKEPKLLHASVGAHYVKLELGIDDPEIFDAIYYHTTSKADMSLLTKIIYIADAIEINRNYPEVESIRQMAFEKLDEAIFMVLKYTIIKLVSSNRMLHTQTVNAMNYFLMKGCKI
ncbi:MAG: bis(5'-nucleosyl)-tetraphosphatase (symmetrical) YqeK [Clostridia bacterium]|nr:bis(5'-nucleosyl)-tetraphosphatase (symmetrical) YqeK [Clostridia bacterium]